MRVVIDTSALYSDLTVARAHARLLLAAAEGNDLELVVPEVVILEAVQKFRERTEQSTREAAKAARDLQGLGVRADIDLPDLDDAVGQYEVALRQRLGAAGVRLPEPPDVSHLDLARRAIEHRKPFDSKGRGYRDSLIWMQVLEEAAGDDVVFVTGNTSDFADDDGGLASDLADELEANGLSRDRVRIAGSMRAVVQEHVAASITAHTRARAALEDPNFRSEIYEAVNEALYLRELPAPSDDDDLRLLDVREVQVDGVLELSDLEVDDAAYDLAEDLVAFNIGGTALTDVEFFPMKYEAYSADAPGVTVSDWDWNEWVVRASKAVELAFEGVVEMHRETGELISIDVWLLQ